MAFLREFFGAGGVESDADEPPYLSADGAIDPSRWFDDLFTVPQAPVYEFASTFGATRMTWTGSSDSGRRWPIRGLSCHSREH